MSLSPSGTPAVGRGAARLRLRAPWPTVRALALLLLALLAGALEAGARLPQVREHLRAPSYDISSRQFEIQWDRLDRFAGEASGVRCVFLGSSEVYRGLDPELFQQVFQAETGRNLLCFNFGVQGLDPLNAAAVARILVDRYHPALILYGLDVPSFTASRAQGIRGDLEQHAWIQYELGKPSPSGWLIDHSYALRDYLVIRNWPRTNFWDQLTQDQVAEAGTNRFGFGPVDRTMTGLNEPPSPNEKEATFSGALSQFEVSPEQLDGFERLLTTDPATQILVVEMPLHPGFMQFFGNGWSDYDTGLRAAQQVAQRHQVILLPTTRLSLVPDSGWFSRNHLNRSGAALFTHWFATTLAQLVQQGKVALPPPGPGGTP
ncbi:MAG: hypothetical protein ABSF61_05920 [Anaerolineales bacterium]|jgi:hypothetical protein